RWVSQRFALCDELLHELPSLVISRAGHDGREHHIDLVLGLDTGTADFDERRPQPLGYFVVQFGMADATTFHDLIGSDKLDSLKHVRQVPWRSLRTAWRCSTYSALVDKCPRLYLSTLGRGDFLRRYSRSFSTRSASTGFCFIESNNRRASLLSGA